MSILSWVQRGLVWVKVSIMVGITWGISSGVMADKPKGGQAVPVKVAPVIDRDQSMVLRGLGSVIANESVDLTTTVTERITALHFSDGQQVKQGDLLVELDSAEELEELAEERFNRDEAQRQVKRLQPLVERGAATQSTLDEARRELQTAGARMRAIQARVEQRRIVAPFSGVVGMRELSVGALIEPGDLITTLVDISQVKLDFSLPSRQLSRIRQTMEVSAQTDAYPAQRFEGKVLNIDNQVDPETRAVRIRAIIANHHALLKPGLLMRVQLPTPPRTQRLIPKNALISRGDQHFVWVVNEEDPPKAELVEITIGELGKKTIEVMAGIDVGQQVIVQGTHKLSPGKAITIQTEDEGRAL